MSKAENSYYDWSISFGKKSESNEINEESTYQENEINSLGIPINEFKNFMKKWKEKHL